MIDTIYALATPFGRSALAVIRVSGKDALLIHDKIFKPKYGTQKYFVATRGDILDIDHVVSIKFPEGKSFTGEPSFELMLHGSPIVIECVLDALHKKGARLANPGEFTLRAFSSGKININEAEAISDLISASSKEAARVAFRNLKGILSDYLAPVREKLIDIISELEANLEFPDENIDRKNYIKIQEIINDSIEKIEKLLQNVNIGKLLTKGARIVLVGYPNAGKSTLFNKLIGLDKALVHETAGTTRDVLEETCVIKGISVTFVDVAGFRNDNETNDPVEMLGIKKAKKELYLADLIISLSEPNADFVSIPIDISVPILYVKTKLDLRSKIVSNHNNNSISVSANTGIGLDSLRREIVKSLIGNSVLESEEPLLTKARQIEETNKIYKFLLNVKLLLNNEKKVDDEIIVFELRKAGYALDKLLGKDIDKDVLDLIFSKFCIGK